MSQLVRLEGKHTWQNAHCALYHTFTFTYKICRRCTNSESIQRLGLQCLWQCFLLYFVKSQNLIQVMFVLITATINLLIYSNSKLCMSGLKLYWIFDRGLIDGLKWVLQFFYPKQHKITALAKVFVSIDMIVLYLILKLAQGRRHLAKSTWSS